MSEAPAFAVFCRKGHIVMSVGEGVPCDSMPRACKCGCDNMRIELSWKSKNSRVSDIPVRVLKNGMDEYDVALLFKEEAR